MKWFRTRADRNKDGGLRYIRFSTPVEWTSGKTWFHFWGNGDSNNYAGTEGSIYRNIIGMKVTLGPSRDGIVKNIRAF